MAAVRTRVKSIQMNLSDIKLGHRLRILPDKRILLVLHLESHGDDALTITYRDEALGTTDAMILLAQNSDRIIEVSGGKNYKFDANAQEFILASEARRISLGHLFDPFLAVNASLIDPLPHQIEAVYMRFLEQQHLRFLLADDPGAGKTIMAGLYCKELMLRGDVERCLIITPGSLVEQWQGELQEKFGLPFDILTRDQIEASLFRNPFSEHKLLIARLDHLARRDDLLKLLSEAEDFDLIIIDEAHKLSAHQIGTEVRETLRYKVGLQARTKTRHLLLMTATPHSGSDEDFQLFMQLLDQDRFAGKQHHKSSPSSYSDLMRRVMKENLLTFDGKRLFPDRIAMTAEYELSPPELELYDHVTAYVRDEMNRADSIGADGDKRRRNAIGFALTILQRRLASSPEAILQSLIRREKWLQDHLREFEQFEKHVDWKAELDDDFDPEEFADQELEDLEEEIVNEASTARTKEDLIRELDVLRNLKNEAAEVRHSGEDRKWTELTGLLSSKHMRDNDGQREKLIIFTEHRDTLTYLEEKIGTFLGDPKAVCAIHGGLNRQRRLQVQYNFINDPSVVVLIATDAAGEGINLQKAHMMINYDLPWNPNRLEQRFGRIHRIGQKNTCYMWNLLASNTREGEVYIRLFEKLAVERDSLGDVVFDILGECFERPLRDLLIEAIRYGEIPEVKERLVTVIDATVGERLRTVWDDRRLAHDVVPSDVAQEIRDDMERARSQKLQPHFISSFFRSAFEKLGGTILEREKDRWEIRYVPTSIRKGWEHLGLIAPRYERIAFDLTLLHVEGKKDAELCAPGTALFEAVLRSSLKEWGSTLNEGTILVDEVGFSDEPRLLFYVDQQVTDGTMDSNGKPHVVAERFTYIEVDQTGNATLCPVAPYSDYRPVNDEIDNVADIAQIITQFGNIEVLEKCALSYATSKAIGEMVDELSRSTRSRVEKVRHAVTERLEAEIRYWDRRCEELKEKELQGKQPKVNSAYARDKAEEMHLRLKNRLANLDREMQLTPRIPNIAGVALVVPASLLAQRIADKREIVDIVARERIDRLAIQAVLATEKKLGHDAREMPHQHAGYDIESRTQDGELKFIEVKGYAPSSTVVMIHRSQVLAAYNNKNASILALVEVLPDDSTTVKYVINPSRIFHEPTLFEDAISLNLRKVFAEVRDPYGI